jgi:CubicO group peptidase (beta-lactamase class C family)
MIPRRVGAPCGSALVAAGALAALALAACGEPLGPPVPGTHYDLHGDWPVATAASVGLDIGVLRGAIDSAAAMPVFRGLLIARYGRLVVEQYYHGADAKILFDVRSVTKSVVSTLTGIAAHDGAMPNLDTSVAAFLAPPYTFTSEDSAITLRDLLTMTSGFAWNDDTDYLPWLEATDHVQVLLDHPRAYPPGAVFNYNTAAVHMLSVALHHAVGDELSHYAAVHLLVPLGVKSITWQTVEPGVVNGGAGFAMAGRDLLKFGQLMLQDGWSGQQSVVPEDWVRDATTPHFSWRVDYGLLHGVSYGDLWWTADAPAPAFFAWGYGGQLVYVVPSEDLVVVTTTDWSGMSDQVALDTAVRIMGLIVTQILPAVVASTGPVAPPAPRPAAPRGTAGPAP